MSRMRITGRLLPLPLLLALGCGGPFLMFPGGALSGEVVSEPVVDWSFVDDRFIVIETRPSDPYSVQLNYHIRDGKLYLDPADGRKWLEHIRADSRMRVRFNGKVYPVTATLVEDSDQLQGFDADRFVYHLESRPES